MVLDIESNSIYVSRDVVFYEHIFPYAVSAHPSTSYLNSFVFPHYTSFEATAPILLSIPQNNTTESLPVTLNTQPVPTYPISVSDAT